MHQEYREMRERAARKDFAALQECFASTGRNDSDEQLAVAAFHYENGARFGYVERDEGWVRKLCNIYGAWLQQNPHGLRKLPYAAPNVTIDKIRRILIGQLLYEPPYPDYLRLIGESLSMQGVEFYAPGGSVQRRVWQLLIELFGIEAGEWSEYLYSVRVRVGLDNIADEVAERCVLTRR